MKGEEDISNALVYRRFEMLLPREGCRVAKIGTPASRGARPQILGRGRVVKLGIFAEGFNLTRRVLKRRVVNGLALRSIKGQVPEEDAL